MGWAQAFLSFIHSYELVPMYLCFYPLNSMCGVRHATCVDLLLVYLIMFLSIPWLKLVHI